MRRLCRLPRLFHRQYISHPPSRVVGLILHRAVPALTYAAIRPSHVGQLSAQRLGLLGAQQHSQATRAVRTATAPFMDDWACQWEMTKLDAPPNPQFHTRQPITKPFVDDPYSSVKVSVRGLLGKWVTYNENWFCFLPNLTF